MGKSLIIKGADFSINGIKKDYREIDYISGEKVLNIEFKERLSNPKIYYKCKILKRSGKVQAVWGNVFNAKIRIAATLATDGGYTAYYGSDQVVALHASDGTVVEQECYDDKLVVNGITYTFNTPDFNTYPLYQLQILGQRSGSGAKSTPYTGFIECKIFNNNNKALLYHLVPVIKKDGVECIYDKVNDYYYMI